MIDIYTENIRSMGEVKVSQSEAVVGRREEVSHKYALNML